MDARSSCAVSGQFYFGQLGTSHFGATALCFNSGRVEESNDMMTMFCDPIMTPGTQLARYKLIERIGAGGMGEVYLAHDPNLDRRVAIKVLPAHLAADPVARQRLRREALAAAALDHPFICKIFEVAEETGTVFVVMEYVRGETLLARMA